MSAPPQLIIVTFLTGIDALKAAEQQLTDRLWAYRDPRCTLLETIPAIGSLSARVLVGALDEASRFDN